MKYLVYTLCAMLFLFSCEIYSQEKNEAIKDLQKIFDTIVKQVDDVQMDDIDGNKKVSPQIEKLRKTLGTTELSFIEEDLTSFSLYGDNKARRKALNDLAYESTFRGKVILAEYYQVTTDELELLTLLPASKKLSSVNVAKEIIAYNFPQKISTHLESGNVSPRFKIITDNYMRDTKLKAKLYIDRAAGAKKEFYALNPGWFGEKEETGDTYIDSRSKFVYLPLGKLSFADKVISHELGNPKGSHKEGAIGEPDFSTEIFDHASPKICNLGIRGVLTLEFTDNAIADVNGPDLYIFEMGAIEPTNLEISKDGKNWINVGKIEGGTAKVDIGPFIKPGETYTYVRLTDLNSPSDLPGADVDAVAAIGGAVRLSLDSAVLFDTGKFELKESATAELQKLVDAIKKISKGNIIIEGHTDNVGNPQSNKILSENRAKEVSAYLKKKLPDKYTFEIRGYGESQPVAPNDTDDNKQKNRRVEILVVPAN